MNDFNKLIKGIAKDAGINEEIIITQKRGAERIENIQKYYRVLYSYPLNN